MNRDQAMAELETLGTEQNRKVYARHGVTGEAFGVSYGNLEKLRKKAGKDTALAGELWATGNHDARVLATKVADPKKVSAETLDAWSADLENYVLTDAVAALAGKSPQAAELAERWSRSEKEFQAAAGWSLLASLAMQAPDRGGLPDEDLSRRLEEIETGIAAAANRVRYAMNNALIAIGAYRPALTERAVAAASAIGPVEVDHGETGCKTPDAAAYIEKTRAHLERKARKKG